MNMHYRCSKKHCRRRVTLTKHIDDYVKRPVCPSCKADSLRHDPAVKARNKVKKCTCDGYWFPHREGSLWCRYATNTPTEDDYLARYHSLSIGLK